MNYDSDHKALYFTLSLDLFPLLDFEATQGENRRNFHKANWPKFSKLLTDSSANFNIPPDRNLSIQEIDNFLKQLNKNISSAIEQSVSKHNTNITSTDKYITPAITNQRLIKSSIITSIHNLSRHINIDDHTAILISDLKRTLKIIRYKIKLAFQDSVSSHWRNKITNISLNNSNDLLPNINKIFRKKNWVSTEALKVHPNSIDLLLVYL